MAKCLGIKICVGYPSQRQPTPLEPNAQGMKTDIPLVLGGFPGLVLACEAGKAPGTMTSTCRPAAWGLV